MQYLQLYYKLSSTSFENYISPQILTFAVIKSVRKSIEHEKKSAKALYGYGRIAIC